MSKGIVYILTNPSLQEWVKIGCTENNDIKTRLSTLNGSSAIPLSFRVYATLTTENPRDVEQRIHKLFDIIDPSLHSIEKLENGKKRVREFFQISPEKAYMVFKISAEMMNIESSLSLSVPTAEEQAEEEIVVSRRGRTTFKMLNIPIDTELVFLKDSNIKCTVIDADNTVLYNGKETTLSAIAKDFLGYNAQGPAFFLYENETLRDRRTRLENEKL